ncbi:ligand-gated ion channel 4-like [Ostrea edulis]|uniref:ligand-gated ion channel 4-like n=1 Tax=Ostrea edulis TaxID=37623 RepID=UPI0024AECEE4|nr:ligand-gated ion channel 4-like [Ostrea edulis]XP_056019874.1 ligand-gated ion channel 4-like [Ostrea edulis]
MGSLVNLKIVLVLTSLCAMTSSSRYELRKNLLQNYEKGMWPNDTATVVALDFNAYRLIEFDDKHGKFSISGYLEVQWEDPRIAKNWNRSVHKSPEIQTMYFSESEVWTPNILQVNPHSRFDVEKMYEKSVMFLSNGSAMMLIGDIFTSECKADSTYFPYDTQNCSIELVVYGHYLEEVVLIPLQTKVNMDFYERNNLWDMKDTRIRTIVRSKLGVLSLSSLNFEFEIRRRPVYYELFLIMPIILMEILQLFSFMLPWDSGERCSFSVTVLLSIAIYLTIVTDQIPKSSEPNISILAKKIFTDLCIGCVVQIFVIISLYTYNLSQLRNQNIPKTCCRGLLTWAQKKDWVFIGHWLDVMFVVLAIVAILVSSSYLLNDLFSGITI